MVQNLNNLINLSDRLPSIPKDCKAGYFKVGVTPVLAALDDEDMPVSVYRFDSKTSTFVADLSMADDILFSSETTRIDFAQFNDAVQKLS